MNQRQITELSQLLDNANYQSIHSRLKSSGLRCGFTCLFYGDPGTGKTETVYQLARLTGRNILQVNVTQIRSCWVGESEKNIRAIFASYRNRVSKAVKAPILLFNEADAIINQRQEGRRDLLTRWKTPSRTLSLKRWRNSMAFSSPPPISHRIWTRPLNVDSSIRLSLRSPLQRLVCTSGMR